MQKGVVQFLSDGDHPNQQLYNRLPKYLPCPDIYPISRRGFYRTENSVQWA